MMRLYLFHKCNVGLLLIYQLMNKLKEKSCDYSNRCRKNTRKTQYSFILEKFLVN